VANWTGTHSGQRLIRSARFRSFFSLRQSIN